ncbi:MAG TPA: sulfate ABC transporter permease subunit CysT [Pirellulales bacterium]|nr:sulfate ABC transporter permease subunit CysT [Pirellulales bacterium]
MKLSLKQPSVLPGFGLTLGYTMVYLSLIVLLPLAALVLKTAQMTWSDFWSAATNPRVVDSYELTFIAALIGSLVNVFFGFAVAWSLVRYSFPLKRVFDAMVDLPFALPTAVSGIALTAIYSGKGWIGRFIPPSFPGAHPLLGGFAYTPIGVTIALAFIGLPFIVRTLQPAIADLDAETEEAAATLGADRWQIFRKIIVPTLLPSILTGFSLAFARALGEYGSVIFIAGTQPKTAITTLVIVQKLDQYDYAGAIAIATVMLVASFSMLFVINLLQWWSARRYRGLT